MKLNEEQTEAVVYDADRIVCVAGAGSGKTECLLRRIKRLEEGGVRPSSILVLTFTRNAAEDMKSRFLEEYSKVKDSILYRAIYPTFCTFHSFCYNMLCKNDKILTKLGYYTVPDIADESEEKEIDKLARELSGIKFNPKNANGRQLKVKEEHALQMYNYHVNHILHQKNLITYDILSDSICSMFAQNDPDIKSYLQQYDYIFVDEFQDTDIDQWNFVQSFKNSKIYVCGDALQNLYSFRGTTNEILKKLVNDDDWKTIKITHNYRSKDNIVNFANEISKYASEDYRIEMTSDNPGGEVSIEKLRHRKFNSNCIQKIEEDYIKNRLLDDMKNREGDFALLCRTNSEVDVIESILLSEEIEYKDTKENSDIPKYIQSTKDYDFFVSWVASFLNEEDYRKFLRKTVTNGGYNYDEFRNLLDNNEEAKYHYDIGMCLRMLLTVDDVQYAKDTIVRLFHLEYLNIPDDISSVENLLDYIEENYSKRIHSNLYVGTIHSVKGLEYDSVVLFGVNDYSFKLDNEDNNNLYYVGATRAKNYLKVFKYEEEGEWY